jgi:hypothetical protein
MILYLSVIHVKVINIKKGKKDGAGTVLSRACTDDVI